MVAPHRSNRTKPPTQDRRRLRCYLRRWLVERFFAWIQWQRGSSFDGNIIQRTSLASFNSPASSSSSGDFEIGSRQCYATHKRNGRRVSSAASKPSSHA